MGTRCKSNPAAGGRNYGSPQCPQGLAPDVPSGTGPLDDAVEDWQLTLAILHTVNHAVQNAILMLHTHSCHAMLNGGKKQERPAHAQ